MKKGGKERKKEGGARKGSKSKKQKKKYSCGYISLLECRLPKQAHEHTFKKQCDSDKEEDKTNQQIKKRHI